MRVGILTFHWNYNFGAVLQAYGLHRTLREIGIESEFINYTPPTLAHHATRGWGLRTGQTTWILLRRFRFQLFRSRFLPASRRFRRASDIASQASEYDGFIVGSDQVWNTELIGAFEPAYFLSFAPPNCRRISYAASFGNHPPTFEVQASMKPLLHSFDHISVREEFALEFVKTLTSRKAELVLDPTLLTGFDSVTAPRVFPREYILVYAIDGKEKVIQEVAAQLRQTLKLPVVAVSVYSDFLQADYLIRAAGPSQWLSLFRHAAFVCTDSFHGTVFALKNRRPFISVAGGGRGGRLADILQRTNVLERLVTSALEVSQRSLIGSPIDFIAAHERLDHGKIVSLQFLRKAMELQGRI